MASASHCDKCGNPFFPDISLASGSLCAACNRPERGAIEAGIFAELSARGAQTTVAGEVALRLAREMDGGAATSSALATLSKQLMVIRAEALNEGDAPEESTLERFRRLAAERTAKALSETPAVAR